MIAVGIMRVVVVVVVLAVERAETAVVQYRSTGRACYLLKARRAPGNRRDAEAKWG